MDSEPSELKMRGQDLVGTAEAADSLRKENEALRARIADLEAAAAAAAGTAEGSTSQIAAPTHPSEPTPTIGGSSTIALGNRTSSNEVGEKARRSAMGNGKGKGKAGMTAAEVARYSRHLLVPAVGVEGQRVPSYSSLLTRCRQVHMQITPVEAFFKGRRYFAAARYLLWYQHQRPNNSINSDVLNSNTITSNNNVNVNKPRSLLGKTCLVIGAGGLASAVLPYLAGAGVGHIRIIDFDKIETSNLHRQVLYRETQAGQSKAKSAAEAIRAINSTVRCTPIEMALTHDNAMDILAGVDLVVDASDNPRTRYLVNDACVLSGKPLVSGSALGMEGQVSVFHHQGGPCYRCVFPAPLAAEAGRRCSDNGVLGTVPGVIGCLQATEALKVLGDFGSPLVGRLCTYDAQDGSFYTVRLRPRSKACSVCGDSPTVTSMEESKDFASKHGLTVERATPETESVPTATCQEYESILAEGRRHVLLDVRVEVQFAVCALDNAVNVPLSRLEASLEKVRTLSEDQSLPVYCVCRRGIDSRAAVAILVKNGFGQAMDVAGGLTEWAKAVDPEFPMY